MAITWDTGQRARSLFAIVPTLGLPDLTRLGKRRRFPKGCVVMVQGEYADAMHVIVEGSVRVTRWNPDLRVKTHLADLGPGEVVGEIGVLSGDPRNATVTALTDVVTVEIDRSLVLHALHAVPGLSVALQQLVKKRLDEITELEDAARGGASTERGGAGMTARAFANAVRSSGAFPELRRHGDEVAFTAGTELMRQGDPPFAMYLIEDGTVRVERMVPALSEPLHVADLGPGDVVGEMGVLTGAPRNATVRAITDVEAIEIPRPQALRAMLEVPGLPDALLRLVRKRVVANEELTPFIYR